MDRHDVTYTLHVPWLGRHTEHGAFQEQAHIEAELTQHVAQKRRRHVCASWGLPLLYTPWQNTHVLASGNMQTGWPGRGGGSSWLSQRSASHTSDWRQTEGRSRGEGGMRQLLYESHLWSEWAASCGQGTPFDLTRDEANQMCRLKHILIMPTLFTRTTSARQFSYIIRLKSKQTFKHLGEVNKFHNNNQSKHKQNFQ